MIKPVPLKRGDTIGIVSPAGPVEKEELFLGVRRLESLGFKILLGKSIHQSFRYLAGTDEERAKDLIELYQKPEVRAVVAARGGYGTLRLIPFLRPEVFKTEPKIVVGSSDLTFLLLFLLRQCQMVSFHGPMVAPNFGRKGSSLTDKFFLWNMLSNHSEISFSFPSVEILRKGRAEGVLTGGCLSLLCQSIGTPFEFETEGRILFLEDIEEAPYRVDRMLTYLKTVGKLKGVRGILFGTMEKCQTETGKSYHLTDVLMDCLKDFPGPILYGFPSGHGEHNVTIPLGVKVSLDGANGELKLLERGTLD